MPPLLRRSVAPARLRVTLRLLALSSASLCVAGLPASACSSPVTDLVERFVALDATYRRWAPDRLPDLSAATRKAVEEKEDELLRELDGVAPKILGREDLLRYEMLSEALEVNRALRICQRHLWTVNHLSGWQVSLPAAARSQPVGTSAARAQALRRWRTMPDYLAADMGNLRVGLASGYAAPHSIVTRVIGQLDTLLALPVDESPFYSPVTRDTDTAFKAAFGKLVADEITPAIRAYRHFLLVDYLPRARADLGISSLPQGYRCYSAFLRQRTSAQLTAEEVYWRGWGTVEANKTAVAALGREVYGTDQLDTLLERLETDPANRFGSRDELLAYSRSLLPHARARSERFFSKMPSKPVVIEPLPGYQEGNGVPARYIEGEAGEPGRYILPLDEWRAQSRGEAEVVLVHETIPGHHLQYTWTATSPLTARLGDITASAASFEGWARYAEILAEEAGIYSSAAARITRRLWSARGMVVDPGLHLFGWSREHALRFILASGRFDEKEAQEMVDRIAVAPAQLTAYDTGALEILALRAEAQSALGARFDLRQFHDRILEQGVIPLTALRARVWEWIEERKRS